MSELRDRLLQSNHVIGIGFALLPKRPLSTLGSPLDTLSQTSNRPQLLVTHALPSQPLSLLRAVVVMIINSEKDLGASERRTL